MSIYLPDPLLKKVHTGPLTIIVHTRDGEIYSYCLDFVDSTLFEYIGEACGRIFTNSTTKLSIQTCPGHWKVLKFSPQERVLEVLQVAGENFVIEEDNFEGLRRLLTT